jgi:hypothetical protein
MNAESGEVTLPHNIPYSQSEDFKQILCEWYPSCRGMWPTSLCFSTSGIEIFVFWRDLRAPYHILSFWGDGDIIRLEAPCFITRYNLAMPKTIIMHGLNQFLWSFQIESVLFLVQAKGTGTNTDLPLCGILIKILRVVSPLISSTSSIITN